MAQPVSTLRGELCIPGDKSISHRALMLGGLAAGTTDIHGFLAGEDCLATLRALQQLGVRIERPGEAHVIVRGRGESGLQPSAERLDMGNAGTAIRLFMGLLAAQPFTSTLVGDASLMRRPMERVAQPLRLMGARIDTVGGKPPVTVHGGCSLHGLDYQLPVASAQIKSALLLAGLRAEGMTRITEPAPSRDHTERMLRAFGVAVRQQAGVISLRGGQALQGAPLQVPADFSSAAFFLVAGCLASRGELLLRGVGVNPTRTGLLELLRQMGADIEVQPREVPQGAEPLADIRVRPSELRAVTVPAELVPLAIDEFPVFFIAAACARGETHLAGAAELRVKESDRLAGMAAGLSVLGVENELLTDGLRIRGGAGFTSGTVDSLGDHRIAMAFAVASLRAAGPIEILDVANVATSFPGFLDTARQAGLQIESG
ncbi:MAG: 3-phosphoshikimate 1-carboxyvinyltransferase [Sinobacteraceae bacterium]|nr:3-phosphoshikimate 1-carboxyvinyltransferase [Nevskiaceae bacterium]